MSLNLLEIVREARGRLGQSLPTSVAGNSDPGVIQMKGMLNEFLEDLVVRKFWQSNVIEGHFDALAQESQGELETLFPGFEGILPDTVYNRTSRLQIGGGLAPRDWAARKAFNFAGPLPTYRLRNNQFLLVPAPVAGHQYYLEYLSSYFVKGVGSTLRKYWLLDTDVCTMGESLPIAYLKWAWKCAKGLEYAEDFRKYEAMLETRSLRDTSPQVIRMDGVESAAGPGIIVTPGSWPV